MSEQPKMKNYEEIVKIVQRLRLLLIDVEAMQKTVEDKTDELVQHGLQCNSVTNCIDVGIMCYKCRNNYSRRSYFRDLLARGENVMLAACADSASMYNAADSKE